MSNALARCPLCHGEDMVRVGALEVAQLIDAYRTQLSVDVSSFFSFPKIELLHCRACELRFFFPLVTGDPGFYRALSQFDFYYMSDKAEFRIAREFIGGKDLVLEVGGGSGAFGGSLAGSQYLGLESNGDAVESARRAGVNMVNEPLEEHAQRNAGRYDIVCSFQVMEHVADPAEFVRSALSALKAGGRLIVSVPSADSFVRHVANDILNMPPHHVTAWSDRALLNLARIFDLDVECIQHEQLARYHRGWYMSAALRNVVSPRRADSGPLLEVGISARLRSRVFGLLGHIMSAGLSPVLQRLPIEFLPAGHTVVVVYRKRVSSEVFG